MRYLATLVMLGLVSGCGSAGDPAEPVADGSVKLLLEDTFADGGLLSVGQDEEGRLSIAVQAPIGSEAEKLLRFSGSARTLTDIYTVLHEAAPLPSEVIELSDAVEGQKLANAAAAPADASDVGPELPVVDLRDKSYSGFINAYCQQFYGGSTKYLPIQCDWEPYRAIMTTYRLVSSDGYSLIDRVYGWNNSQYWAKMGINQGTNPWTPDVAPYTTIWVQWGGTYTSQRAVLWTTPIEGFGELGITLHDARPNVQ